MSMAQQNATDDDAQLAHELADLSVVADATAHVDAISVTFSCSSIPESFNAQMLSDGYAVSTAECGPQQSQITAEYRNITNF